MSTTSRCEWWFVTSPETGLGPGNASTQGMDAWPAEHPDTIHGSAQPRVAIPLADFDEARRDINASLKALEMKTIDTEEFIGCRMYTG